ncbi:MAG: hypothetical protein HY775_13655, partial [Acidobacteria bacterium]|nr:hypothetical protein [Acidobacteriota bacterium]
MTCSAATALLLTGVLAAASTEAPVGSAAASALPPAGVGLGVLGGLFVGLVTQGAEVTHTFDSIPLPCPAVITTYRVTLTYFPQYDVLTLAALGKEAAGQAGHASVSGQADVCPTFPI